MPTPKNKISNRAPDSHRVLILNFSFLIPNLLLLALLISACNKPLPNPAPLPIHPTLRTKPEAKPATTRAINGRELYNSTCTSCHAIDGSGLLGEPSNLQHSTLTTAQTKDIITNGVPDKGMASFKAQFTPEEIDSLTTHVMRLHLDQD